MDNETFKKAKELNERINSLEDLKQRLTFNSSSIPFDKNDRELVEVAKSNAVTVFESEINAILEPLKKEFKEL